MKRTLALKRETLTDLTGADLERVAAGQAISQECPSNYCWSGHLDCLLSQYLVNCVTD